MFAGGGDLRTPPGILKNFPLPAVSRRHDDSTLKRPSPDEFPSVSSGANRLGRLDDGGDAGNRKMRDAISQFDQIHFDQILQVQLAYRRNFQTIGRYVPKHPAEVYCPVAIGATRADVRIGDCLK